MNPNSYFETITFELTIKHTTRYIAKKANENKCQLENKSNAMASQQKVPSMHWSTT